MDIVKRVARSLPPIRLVRNDDSIPNHSQPKVGGLDLVASSPFGRTYIYTRSTWIGATGHGMHFPWGTATAGAPASSQHPLAALASMASGTVAQLHHSLQPAFAAGSSRCSADAWHRTGNSAERGASIDHSGT